MKVGHTYPIAACVPTTGGVIVNRECLERHLLLNATENVCRRRKRRVARMGGMVASLDIQQPSSALSHMLMGQHMENMRKQADDPVVDRKHSPRAAHTHDDQSQCTLEMQAGHV